MLLLQSDEKDQLQQSTFETEIWGDINNEFKNITGVNFGVAGLKKKFDRLCFEYTIVYVQLF